MVNTALEPVVESDDERTLRQLPFTLTDTDELVHVDRPVAQRGEPAHMTSEIPDRDRIPLECRVRMRRNFVVHEDGYRSAGHELASLTPTSRKPPDAYRPADVIFAFSARGIKSAM